MDDYLSETGATRIGIGGIKFSPELVQYTHRAGSPADRSLADLLRRIAERRINLPFLCASAVGEDIHSTFCVAAADFALVEMLVDSPLRARLQVVFRVGTLTLFPHRRNLALLGRAVEALEGSGIVIHSLCTSISALAINIDYLLLDRAAEVLGGIVELPENHSPFRSEFRIRQINPDNP